MLMDEFKDYAIDKQGFVFFFKRDTPNEIIEVFRANPSDLSFAETGNGAKALDVEKVARIRRRN